MKTINLPHLAQRITNGEAIIDDTQYIDGVFVCNIFAYNVDIDPYLDELNDIGEVIIDQYDLIFEYEEVEYDYNGCYFEGGISSVKTMTVRWKDVTPDMVNQRVKEHPEILKLKL